MRKMGIDYGSKKIGIAMTDIGGNMAFPYVTISNDNNLLRNLERIITEKEVDEIVIGYSLGRDGVPNAIHECVKGLITEITLLFELPIHLHPEHYTTQEAIRIQGKNTKVNESAAAIILNSYLTQK